MRKIWTVGIFVLLASIAQAKELACRGGGKLAYHQQVGELFDADRLRKGWSEATNKQPLSDHRLLLIVQFLLVANQAGHPEVWVCATPFDKGYLNDFVVP